MGDTQPPSLRTPIAAEPLNKRPFDPHVIRDDSRRHLRLAPDPAVAATIAPAAAAEGATVADGLASVTHLPTYISAEEEHDGEDFPRQVAAALPVPRP